MMEPKDEFFDPAQAAPGSMIGPEGAAKLRATNWGDPLAARAEWAGRIREAWAGALDAVLETGRRLIAAKAALAHGEFERMIGAELPFTPSTARRLMSIASDVRISNRAHAHVLPPTWTTLYELTKLDDDALAAAFAAGEIRPDMERADATRLLTAPRREKRLAKAEARGASAPPLADVVKAGRRWPVIYADPPWRTETWSENGQGKAADNHYATMTADELRALPVGELAAPDAALFLWATVPHLALALELVGLWGFEYRSHLVWIKTDAAGAPHRGTGHWFINAHELLLVGTRGRIPAPVKGTQSLSVVEHAIGPHSAKPDVFRKLIEGYFPGVGRLELFARGPAEGWDVWGDEASGAEHESETAGERRSPIAPPEPIEDAA